MEGLKVLIRISLWFDFVDGGFEFVYGLFLSVSVLNRKGNIFVIVYQERFSSAKFKQH